VERVLADIDANHGDRRAELLRHSVLLGFGAPGKVPLPAGQEHGRTIPLADYRQLSSLNVLEGTQFLNAGHQLIGTTGIVVTTP
jgi:hypothetical protein